jgi:beta-lactamase regulating signal transducer with metallopeptidase domain
MNHFLAHPLGPALIPYVIEPAARSLVLAGAVWLALTALRVRDIGLRLAAWTVVLCAALLMPLLPRLMPQIPLLLPARNTAVAAAANFNGNVRWEAPAIQVDIASAGSPVPSGPVKIASPIEAISSETHAKQTQPAATLGEDSFPLRSAESQSLQLSPAKTDSRATEIAGSSSPVPANKPISWLTLAAAAYCLIAGALLGRLMLGYMLRRRLEQCARPIENARLAAILREETGKIGLRRAPRVAEAGALSVPVAMGVLRPLVLFPAGWGNWTESELRAVFAHELSHIARRDVLTQTLAKIHRAIFWFSPLGWWLDRTIVDLAEQASDDAALRAGADRTGYAEVLLNFLRAIKTGQRRLRWEAVSIAQGTRSARRLERILSGARLSARVGGKSLATVAIAVVPLVFLTAGVEPTFPAQSQMPPPPAIPAPPAPPASAMQLVVVAPVPAPPKALGGQNVPVAPAPMPAPAGGAVAPAIPPAPAAPPNLAGVPFPLMAGPGQSEETETWYSSEDCSNGNTFAIVSGNKITMQCGSDSDFGLVQKLHERIKGDFVWFRKSGHTYIVSDPETVEQALAAFGPIQELARQQAELGREQAALGAKQAALGMQQAESRLMLPHFDFSAQMREMDKEMRAFNTSKEQADMSRYRKEMQDAFKQLNSAKTQEALARAQEQIALAMQKIGSSTMQQAMAHLREQMAMMQARLGTVQANAGERQAELGRQQAALGERQAALGRKQAALGREQTEAARQAIGQIQKLLDQAMAKGLAKRP